MKKNKNPFSPVDLIIDYERGMLEEDDTVKLFQVLISNGTAWSLQGHYETLNADSH